jgi:response regulator RpfG family c-di-GMP phosphodiesterase
MRTAIDRDSFDEDFSSFLNPLDASLRVCIEVDRALKTGIDPDKLDNVRTLLEVIIQEAATVNYELARLIQPIDLMEQSTNLDLGSMTHTNRSYPDQVEELKSYLSVIDRDLATNEQLQRVRNACWQIHELLAVARHTRLAQD